MVIDIQRRTSQHLAIKPGQAIFVANNLTSGARKLWNVMFHLSRDEVLAEDVNKNIEHFVPYPVLAKCISTVGLDPEVTSSKTGDVSRAWMRKIIKELRDTDINILHLDENTGDKLITETKYLAEATWSKEGVYFSFGKRMRGFMLGKLQAHIDLLTQSMLKSKYSQALYEIACYLAVADVQIANQTISLTNAINLLVDGNIERFQKDTNIFNARVIQPALAEVNQETDLHLDVEFITEKIPGKRGRPKVCGLKFHVSANENLPKHLQSVFPLTEKEHEEVKQHPIYLEVVTLIPEIPTSWMHHWATEYPFETETLRWQDAISAYKQWIASKISSGQTIAVPARGFKMAIEQAWKPNKTIIAQTPVIDLIEQKAQERAEANKQLVKTNARKKQAFDYYDEVEQSNPEQIEQALKEYFAGEGSPLELMNRNKNSRDVTGFVPWFFRMYGTPEVEQA